MWRAPFAYVCRRSFSFAGQSINVDLPIGYDKACESDYGSPAYHVLNQGIKCYKSVKLDPSPDITSNPSDPDPIELCLRLPWDQNISPDGEKMNAIEVSGDRTTHSDNAGEPRIRLDFKLNEGTPVLAAHSGWVFNPGWNDGGGWAITLCMTSDGKGKPCSVYAHLQYNPRDNPGHKPGQYVKQGQHIGWSGNTGTSTGEHLHFSLVAYLYGPDIPAIFMEVGKELTVDHEPVKSQNKKR